jgi:hypothetical protein
MAGFFIEMVARGRLGLRAFAPALALGMDSLLSHTSCVPDPIEGSLRSPPTGPQTLVQVRPVVPMVLPSDFKFKKIERDERRRCMGNTPY